VEEPKKGKIHYFGPLFGIFRGGKGSRKYGKFYLLDILYTHQGRQFWLVKFFQNYTVWEITSLAKNFKSGKMGEKDNVVISRLLQFFIRASN
jgi:hypothetical protein